MFYSFFVLSFAVTEDCSNFSVVTKVGACLQNGMQHCHHFKHPNCSSLLGVPSAGKLSLANMGWSPQGK